jgi:hypothetical protein
MLLSLPPSLNHKYPQMMQVLNFAGYGSGTRDVLHDLKKTSSPLSTRISDAGKTVAHILSLPKWFELAKMDLA